MISVIIPAFNEAAYLPQTLAHLHRAVEQARLESDQDVEILVIDNASTDRTAEVAVTNGARVIVEPEHNIARVRNAGAAAAQGDLLIFLDADTLVPDRVLSRILAVMSDSTRLGGAVDTDYQPVRPLMRTYLRGWRWVGLTLGMAQGALQFCRRAAFATLGGYDESMYMGEDVDFYWRLGKLARSRGEHVGIIRDVRVIPSCRRFDQWPTWRLLVETNPLYITCFQRRATAWRGWYGDVPR